MCLSPYRFKDKVTGDFQDVNCQKCIECRNAISNHFAMRVNIECKKSNYKPYFITFTIENQYYVYTPKQYKKYLIDMIKKMRYYKHDFKYILSVERGDKTGRLHGHMIIMLDKNKLNTFNLLREFYDLGFIKIQDALYKDIHYVVAYIYDGVVYRTFSKGLGKPKTNEELFLIFIHTPFSEIPLYFRRLVQKLNEGLYKRKYISFLYSPENTEIWRKKKSQEYRDKKFEKLLQIKYNFENYIVPTYKVDSVTGRRITNHD